MKNLYKNYCVVLFLLFCLSSCVPKQLINVSSGHDASEAEKGNFILLKSGREIKLPDRLDLKSGILNVDRTRKIKINDTKYSVKDIQSIQINGEYFVNIGKKQFVKRIYHGPLNVYNRYQTTTSSSYSYNGAGPGASSYRPGPTTTHVSTQYFIQKDSVANGEAVRISGFSNQKKLMPLISDYKPSKEILEKYQRQRRIGRIVKFSVAGLWATSLPIALAADEDSKLANIAAGTFLAGAFAVPVFVLTFKSGNHKRPYKAVQTYIDNNFYKDEGISAFNKDTSDLGKNKSDTIASTLIQNETIKDFVILNNKQQIIADSGSKLLIANNKMFSINGLKYSTDVTAFQLRKKFYKRLPEKEEEFGLRIVSGSINVYQKTKHFYWNNVNSNSVDRRGYSVSPILGGKYSDRQYYDKEGADTMMKNAMKIGSFFQDDRQSAVKYSAWVRHVRRTQLVSYGLSAVTLGSLTWLCVNAFDKNKSMDYSFFKDPAVYICVGSSILNLTITINNVKKLNPELMSVIKGYNRRKSI